VKIIKFKESNIEFAKDQPEYITMPAHKSDDNVVTSCWKLTLWERIKILFTGIMWSQLLTGGNPQPQKLLVNRPWKKHSKLRKWLIKDLRWIRIILRPLTRSHK